MALDESRSLSPSERTTVRPPGYTRNARAGRRLSRAFAAVLLVFGLSAAAVGAPSVVAPGTASRAAAAVYDCGCPSSAYTMLDRWEALRFPKGAAWRQIGTNQWLYGGAVHQNREGQLPSGGNYREYDAQVYSYRGQSRGAKRIVVDLDAGEAWYSPNHYTDFYRM
jgi:hypothetical protein